MTLILIIALAVRSDYTQLMTWTGWATENIKRRNTVEQYC